MSGGSGDPTGRGPETAAPPSRGYGHATGSVSARRVRWRSPLPAPARSRRWMVPKHFAAWLKRNQNSVPLRQTLDLAQAGYGFLRSLAARDGRPAIAGGWPVRLVPFPPPLFTSCRSHGPREDDDLHPQAEPRSGGCAVSSRPAPPRRTVSTQARIASILTSPTCAGHLSRARHAQVLGQIGLTPRTDQRATRTISPAGGTLSRAAGQTHSALGRPPRRIRRSDAGLCNTP